MAGAVIWFSGNSAAVIGPADAAPESNVAARPAHARSTASAVVPLCYLLAAVLLTRNLWADPASRLVTGNPHDTDQFAWFMRYAATAVRQGRLPALVTTGMNAPAGVNLMWNTSLLLPGVVLAPVTWLAGPQVSLTILTTAGFAASATALFWVLRRWDVSVGAAALAGAVYGFSPALLQSAIGHYDLQLAILPPLIISAGVRLTAGPPSPASRPAGSRARWLTRVPSSARTGAWLGLLVAAQVFINEEVALATALAGVLVVAVLAASRPGAAVRRVEPAAAGLVTAAVVALALTGPALWTQFHGPLIEHGAPYSPNTYRNDLTSFVTPQSALFFHTAASAAAAASYRGGPPEYLPYLGWPLIAALVVSSVVSWRRLAGRAATVTFVLLCVFSLGPHPLIAGRSYAAVDLPWHWLEKIYVVRLALPDRLSILADGAAATLLAIGVDVVRARLAKRGAYWQRPGRLGPAAVFAVAALCCLPLLPRPLPASGTMPLPAGWPAMFARLNLRPGSSVLVLPVPLWSLTLAMRWSAESGDPSAMIGGYFIGPKSGEAQLGRLITRRAPIYLNYLWAQGVPPGSPYSNAARGALAQWTRLDRQPDAPQALARSVVHVKPALAVLASWRPQAVVADAAVSSPLGEYLARLIGPPTVTVDGLIGWRLSGTLPPGTSELLSSRG